MKIKTQVKLKNYLRNMNLQIRIIKSNKKLADSFRKNSDRYLSTVIFKNWLQEAVNKKTS